MNDDAADRFRSGSEGIEPIEKGRRVSGSQCGGESRGEGDRRTGPAIGGATSVIPEREGFAGGLFEPGERERGGLPSGTRAWGTDRSMARPERASDTGSVSLVGAGPGHPDLLTRRAWKRLSAADVIMYDSLVDERVIAELQGIATVDVGKRPPNRTSQEEINSLLCEYAREGERVVRLKGGDPCLFGRGGEEAIHLASEGIDFEIVPGVSSALAAPSVGGIPLTHRGRASSVTVLTGHETPEKDESALDWDALAGTVATGGTLVILMGVRRLAENVRALRERELAPETPVAMVQDATREGERTLVATLGTIVERRERAGIEPPAVTIVGDVVSIRESVEKQLLG